MKRVWLIAVAGALGAAANGQPAHLVPATVRSRSGQFVVHAAPGAGKQAAQLSTNQSLVLEPTLVAVSAERIKQLLYRRLDANAPWRGRIYLMLNRARDLGEPVTITAERFTDGWQYRVDLPDLIERQRYVRAMVQALLLEMANRSARERSTEVPSWLVEGFSQDLLRSSQVQIVLSPPPPGTNGISFLVTELDGRKENPLKHAHDVLVGRPALTYDELSWWADGGNGEIYDCSAQVFVHELLQLNDGPACMRAMVAELPQHYNWQFAFLHAFRAHFTRPLEVEKWWALQVAHFAGRDLVETWPETVSWEKLDQAVHWTTETRHGPDELPQPVEISLQYIINEWNLAAQRQALQTKVVELESVALRVARAHVELVTEYRQALQEYLRASERLMFMLPSRRETVSKRIAETALKQLDDLDRRRLALRPQPSPTQASASPPPTD